MKKLLLLTSIVLLSFSCQQSSEPSNGLTKSEYALVIHGGAGNMSIESVSPENQDRYLAKLNEALDTGIKILEENGSSLDAVEKVINILEDSPLFNAGKGAVFTHHGTNELDASIMEGDKLNAGAVAGVQNIKNPISAARAVMEQSEHVLLSGDGASEFAGLVGLEIVDPSYFFTERKFNNLIRVLESEGEDTSELQLKKMGTVGCVALDKLGNLCAGTSTGGMTNKKYNRIGDSPVIGAGTYANNATCGVSATGHGEFFIRYAVAHDISALMEYKRLSVEQAAYEVIQNKLFPVNGSGGVVCLDSNGNYAMEFNTKGMFRAYDNAEGDRIVKIFKD
ncbi:MAG: isoaspartyl peptidase/L-asparaginase [Bacteroidales bacterium]|nr:isoaspartyl peptidase/L-asparaginase [Bacteroidales bacterium]